MTTVQRGYHLGTLLNNQIAAIIADETRPEEKTSELAQAMANRAGLAVATVYDVLGGTRIVCPPLIRLQAFADVLGMSASTLIRAAERDGCVYSDKDMEEEMGRVIMDWLRRKLGISLVARTIKEVDSWDGSASRWDTADDYCQACLIDVNSAAGRDEKAKGYCFLPVRDPGDTVTVYVDKAVFAAAGGRGIGAVVKPDDVSQEDWDVAVKRAANKLIDAYRQMDRVAPNGVYEAAGQEPPEERTMMSNTIVERDLNLSQAWEQVWAALRHMHMLDYESEYLWPVDLYYADDRSLYLIASREGHLYQMPVIITGDTVTLGEMIPVLPQFVPVEAGQARTLITRTADGRVRVTTVACSAVLNRVGEIDSRALFDNFVRRAKETGLYPVVGFGHPAAPGRLAQCDFLGRNDYLYLVSYVFDDTPVGRAAGEGYAADPVYWGHSIEFDPLARQMVEVAPGVTVPVYTDGVNTAIAIYREAAVAAFYTATKVVTRGRINMNFEDLLKLFNGDEELARQYQAQLDAANQRIGREGQITRTAAPVDPTTGTNTALTVDHVMATDLPTELDLDGAAFQELITRLAHEPTVLAASQGNLAALQEQIAQLTQRVNEAHNSFSQAVRVVERRVEALEKPETQKQQDWLRALPAQPTQARRATLRLNPNRLLPVGPLGAQPPDGQSRADIADSTLANLPDMPF